MFTLLALFIVCVSVVLFLSPETSLYLAAALFDIFFPAKVYSYITTAPRGSGNYMDPIHIYYIHTYIYAPIWSGKHNIYIYTLHAYRHAYIHTRVHTYLHTRIHANSFLRLTVADRSATVKGSGSMGRPLGRHRARSSIIGTDADTCRGQCILSLAALLRGPGPRGPG